MCKRRGGREGEGEGSWRVRNWYRRGGRGKGLARRRDLGKRKKCGRGEGGRIGVGVHPYVDKTIGR